MKTIPLLRYLSLLILSYASIATAQPVANFTANKTSGCSPLTIQFTSTSTGNPTSYLWSFGNSNTSIIQNPSATYVLPGTYTVSLNVTNSLGSDTKTITSYITVYANPTANFTANPVSGCIPLSAAFTNTSISGSAAITSWTWDFGNGNIGSTQNPTSTYSIASSYNVTLSVRDVNGCESTITKPNFITTSNAYTADFSATGKVNCVFPATVNFTSTTSVSGTYTYLWDFGDGTNSTQANPTKIYTTAGLYNVVLEVTAANGCKQVVTKNAFAEIGGVKANFTFTTTNDCAPSFVTLTNTTTPYPTGHSYRWLLDGGSSKTTQNASYNLTSKTSVIYLRVQTTAGCIDTIKKTITLQDPPTADFSVDSDYFCNFPATVNFTNLSSGGATQFSWNYGNSFGSGATNPVYTYNAVGQYKVKLIATRPNGCRDTIIKTVTVDGRSLVTIKDHNIKSGCAPYLAKFKVTDSRYRIFTTWKWQLNGTTISNNRDFDYTFNDTGKYVLKLTGTNAEGCFYEAYDTVEVSPEPLFDFVVDNNNICFNPGILKLMYVPLNNVVPDLVKWTIIGNTQNIKTSGDTIIVKLSDTGFYNVMAIASKKGCETTVSKLNFIRVNPAIADFDFRIGDCATDTVHFYNLSIGKNKISWDFDDSGATSTANDSTIHVYKKAGAYLVKLIELLSH